MKILDWYIYCLKNYFTMKGRASRAQYWSFFLVNFVILFVLGLLFGTTETAQYHLQGQQQQLMGMEYVRTLGFPASIYFLFTVIPTITASVRRLHDRDHTGWWVFWGILFGVINIVVLVFCVLPSLGPNKYGVRAPSSPSDAVPPNPGYTYNPYGQQNQGYSQQNYNQYQNQGSSQQNYSPYQNQGYSNNQNTQSSGSNGNYNSNPQDYSDAEIVPSPMGHGNDRPDRPNVYTEFGRGTSNPPPSNEKDDLVSKLRKLSKKD